MADSGSPRERTTRYFSNSIVLNVDGITAHFEPDDPPEPLERAVLAGDGQEGNGFGAQQSPFENRRVTVDMDEWLAECQGAVQTLAEAATKLQSIDVIVTNDCLAPLMKECDAVHGGIVDSQPGRALQLKGAQQQLTKTFNDGDVSDYVDALVRSVVEHTTRAARDTPDPWVTEAAVRVANLSEVFLDHTADHVLVREFAVAGKAVWATLGSSAPQVPALIAKVVALARAHCPKERIHEAIEEVVNSAAVSLLNMQEAAHGIVEPEVDDSALEEDAFDEAGHALLLQANERDFTHFDTRRFLYVAPFRSPPPGEPCDGPWPVVVIIGANVPEEVDYEELLLYFVHFVSNNTAFDEPYTLVYLHCTTRTRPPLSWLKQLNGVLKKRVRKNLKALLVVQASFWSKSMLELCRPFLSSKFYQKVVYVDEFPALLNIIPAVVLGLPLDIISMDARVDHELRAATPPTSTWHIGEFDCPVYLADGSLVTVRMPLACVAKAVCAAVGKHLNIPEEVMGMFALFTVNTEDVSCYAGEFKIDGLGTVFDVARRHVYSERFGNARYGNPCRLVFKKFSHSRRLELRACAAAPSVRELCFKQAFADFFAGRVPYDFADAIVLAACGILADCNKRTAMCAGDLSAYMPSGVCGERDDIWNRVKKELKLVPSRQAAIDKFLRYARRSPYYSATWIPPAEVTISSPSSALVMTPTAVLIVHAKGVDFYDVERKRPLMTFPFSAISKWGKRGNDFVMETTDKLAPLVVRTSHAGFVALSISRAAEQRALDDVALMENVVEAFKRDLPKTNEQLALKAIAKWKVYKRAPA